MGKRQDEQAQRLQQVKDASWRLYLAQGFEATTVRQIAAEAGVATGTVINAGEKGGLLVQLFEDAVRERVRPAAPEYDGDLVTAVCTRFEVFFDFYREHPDLTRAYLRELLTYAHGTGKWGDGLVTEFLRQLTEVVERGGLTPHQERTQLLVETLFAVYIATLVGWLTGTLTADQAVAHCRRHITHHITAFQREN